MLTRGAAPWSHYNRQLMVMGRGGTHRGIERATLQQGGTLKTNSTGNQAKRPAVTQERSPTAPHRCTTRKRQSFKGKTLGSKTFVPCFPRANSAQCHSWQLSKSKRSVKSTNRCGLPLQSHWFLFFYSFPSAPLIERVYSHFQVILRKKCK